MTSTDDTMNQLLRAGRGEQTEQDEQTDETEQAVPSFDGGARETAPKAKDMNTIIRQATGYGR